MWRLMCRCFPPGTRAKNALMASDQSQIERTPFFGVTMFGPSRFISSTLIAQWSNGWQRQASAVDDGQWLSRPVVGERQSFDHFLVHAGPGRPTPVGFVWVCGAY